MEISARRDATITAAPVEIVQEPQANITILVMGAAWAAQDTRALIESASIATIRGRADREAEATPHTVIVAVPVELAAGIEQVAVEVAARHRLFPDPPVPPHTHLLTRRPPPIRPGHGIGIIIVLAATTTSIAQDGSCLNRFIKLFYAFKLFGLNINVLLLYCLIDISTKFS